MNEITAGLLHEMETRTNKLAGRLALILSAMGLAVAVGYVVLDKDVLGRGVSVLFISSMLMLLVFCFVSEAVKYDRPWLKHILVFGISFTVLSIMSLSAHGGCVYASVPILLASRYLDKSYVIKTAVATAVFAAIGHMLGEEELLIHISVEILFLIIVTFLAYKMAEEGRETLVKQGELMQAQKETEIAQAEKNVEMVGSRTRLMRSQLQPHFLFNSLATIGAISRRDGRAAYQAISDFADYLRLNLSSLTKEGTVPFREELEHTEKYLKLEKMRFGDDLDIRYNIKFDAFGIPLITLQPIVENAILHGMCRDDVQKWVSITSELDGNHAVVTVEDNGVGFDTVILKDPKYAEKGIANIRNRLREVADGRLEVVSRPGKGTVVTIRIPLEQEL